MSSSMLLSLILSSDNDIRILDYFMGNRPKDYTAIEVGKAVCVSTTKTAAAIDKFIYFGIVEESRRLNRMRFYRLANNEETQNLIKFAEGTQRKYAEYLGKVEENLKKSLEKQP